MAKKRKIKVDGQEYNLDDFDDRHYWSKDKKKKIKSRSSGSSSGFMGLGNTVWE